ncbi:MAG: methionine ABC transporter permease, partial [Lachnospiraceae bacterium]|nr:methionine ABC transporter permease [Lachnospiraceae bacterium]
MWTSDLTWMMAEGVRDTLLMTLLSTFFGYLIGLPLGIVLAVTDRTGIRPNAAVYKALDVTANILRSIPF